MSMDGKRYYWLKLKEDFFKSKRIKKLRNMAGGDTYTIIYLKMQLLALRTEGVLTWTGLEENFADELALDLDEKPEDVEVTLMYLLKTGLAESVDNVSFLLPWVLENTGSETASTQRWRDWKARQALVSNTMPTESKRIANVEKEIEIEKELEIEQEAPHRKTDFDRVAEAWNSLGLSKVSKIASGTERYNLLNKRIKDYGIDRVLEAIENVRKSSFLMGGGKNGWTATFDWFIKPNNFPKVLDGNYIDTDKPNKNSGRVQSIPPGDAKDIWKLVDRI